MNRKLIDLSTLRREYNQGELRRNNLTSEPMELFEQWLIQAYAAYYSDANVMSVSTVDRQGQPYQRLVLLKHFDHQSMVFYTNYTSRKAQHLEHNSRISLHFPWQILERQVLVLGRAEKLSVIEVIKYFNSRPRDSQISAWVSRQSSHIDTRTILDNHFIRLKQQFSKEINIPVPSFWGGYRINIDAMEFWQGGKYRLHDRFLYQRKNNVWHVNRLAP